MKDREAEKILFENLALKKLYEETELAYQISRMVAKARIDKGWTQEELARRLGTKQPSIARIENYTSLPSLTMLEKIADALGYKLEAPRFVDLSNVAETESYKFVYKVKDFITTQKYKLGGSTSGEACLVNN